MDSIFEAFYSDDLLLNQLSTVCLATLFSTLNNLANCKDSNSSGNNSETKQSILSTPSVVKVLNFVEKNCKIFEKDFFNQVKRKAKSDGHDKWNKYSSKRNCYNFRNIKDRICGFDSKTFENQANRIKRNSSTSSECGAKRYSIQQMYMKEDFNYRDKLKSLICSEVSSESTTSFDSRTVDLESGRIFNKSIESGRKVLASRTLHLSLQDVRKADHWSARLSKRFHSDPRLVRQKSLVSFEPINFDQSESSVFDSSTGTATEDEEEEESDGQDEIDIVLGKNNRSMFPFDDRSSSASLNHFERALAKIFVRKLRSSMSELIHCRNLILVDEFIQLFSSNYCKGDFLRKSNFNILLS